MSNPENPITLTLKKSPLRPWGITIIPVLLAVLFAGAVVAVTLIAPAVPDPAVIAPSDFAWFTVSQITILTVGWVSAATVIAAATAGLALHGGVGVVLGYAIELFVPVSIGATVPGLVSQIGLITTPLPQQVPVGPTGYFIVLGALLSITLVAGQVRGLSRRTADLRTSKPRTAASPAAPQIAREPDITSPDAGAIERYSRFMTRSLPKQEALVLAEKLMAQVRFHTAYQSFDPVPARLQFLLPSGAMLVTQDRLEHHRRCLDFIYAQGVIQFQSTITFRRPVKDDQASAWFSEPMTNREVEKVLGRLQGIIDTSHNAARAQRDPNIPLIDLMMAPARIAQSRTVGQGNLTAGTAEATES